MRDQSGLDLSGVTDWRVIHRVQYGRHEEVKDGVPIEPYKEHTVMFLVQVLARGWFECADHQDLE